MPIVFAENFKQDTSVSILSRYPGTLRTNHEGGLANREDAFPINYGSYFQTGTIPFGSDNERFEVRLEMSGVTDSAGFSTLNVFGIPIISTNGANLTILGIDTGLAALPNPTVLNIILERASDSYHLIALVNNDVVILPTLVTEEWVPASWIGGLVPGTGTQITGIPPWLDSVVVAVDTPAKTRLGPTTWTKRQIEATSTGDWVYTDVGYVEDTDKQDPLNPDPNIGTQNQSTIVYEMTDSVEADVTNLYVSTASDLAENALIVNGVAEVSNASLRALPVRTAGSSITLESSYQPGLSNNDGLVFLGERSDLITYADFCTAVGFTAGALNTEAGTDAWLEFILDGKRLIVSKIPVRYALSWDQIYQAGLVYGTDDFGLYPTGTPVNQLKTIELEGNTYKVRLLKGTDTDPYYGFPGTTDPAGSRRSEWARLFYPICSASVPSYTGSKLASYTEAQLGIDGSLNGRAPWCQEVQQGGTSRIFRGSTGISYLGARSSSSAVASNGYRPCLELI